MAKSQQHPIGNPLGGLRAPLRPSPAYAETRRTLTAKQQALPFLGRALATLQALPEARDQLLPRLRRARGDRQTRIEVYQALAAISSPMLARYDLATGILGWLEDDGQFCLNSQRRLAHDSGLSPAVLNRLIKRLAAVGYAKRRIELVSGRSNGEQYVRTRVLIQFTDLFWRHLNLSLAHGMARKAARKRRQRQLHQIQQDHLSRFTAREAKRKKREMAVPRSTPTPKPTTEAELHRRSDLLLQLRAENPSLDAAAIRSMADDILSRTD